MKLSVLTNLFGNISLEEACREFKASHKKHNIEHEDSLMKTEEGLCEAVEFLKKSVIRDPKPSTAHRT